VAAVLAGAIGGLVNAVFTTGGVTLPGRLFQDKEGNITLALGTLVSILTGAAAGFIGWASYTQAASFDQLARPLPIAASLSAGWAGGRIFAGPVFQKPKDDATQNAIQNALQSVENLAEEAASSLESGG